MNKDLSLDVPLHKVDELTEAFRQRNERISTLTAERDELLEALENLAVAYGPTLWYLECEVGTRGLTEAQTLAEDKELQAALTLIAKHRDPEKKEQ